MSHDLEGPAEAIVDSNGPPGGWGTIVRISRALLVTGGVVLNWLNGAPALLGGLLYVLGFICFAIPPLVYLLRGRVQGRLRSAMIAIASGWVLAAVACPFSTREASTIFDPRIVWTGRALLAAGLLLAVAGGLSERRLRRGLSNQVG
jgi:hypothetical protein